MTPPRGPGQLRPWVAEPFGPLPKSGARRLRTQARPFIEYASCVSTRQPWLAAMDDTVIMLTENDSNDSKITV